MFPSRRVRIRSLLFSADAGRGAIRRLGLSAFVLLGLAVPVSTSVVSASTRPSAPPGRARMAPQVRRQRQRALGELRRHDRATQHHRASTLARRERTRSRFAYRHLGAAAALAADRAAFGNTAFAPAFSAVRPAAHVRLVRQVGPTAELVTDTETDKKSVLESSLPLQSSIATGHPAPVDLSLTDQGMNLTPRNPVHPLLIGQQLTAGFSFPRSDFGIHLEGASDSHALTEDAGAFFPNAATDTDFQVNASPFGAETLVDLRSPASPQRFVMSVDLPPGASLIRSVSTHPIPGDPPRSISIVLGSMTLGYVYPPVAYDADGTPIPTDMSFEGNNIVLRVLHRTRDLHYPAVLDPLVAEYDNSSSSPPWASQHGIQQITYPQYGYTFGQVIDDPNYWASGLYASMPTNHAFGQLDHAQWNFTPPRDAQLNEYELWGWTHYYIKNESYAYTGMSIGDSINDTWESNFRGLSTNPSADLPNGQAYTNSFTGLHATYCYRVAYGGCDNTSTRGNPNDVAVVGIGAYDATPGATYVLTPTSPPVPHVTLDGIGLYLGDQYAPGFSSVPSSSGWTNDSGSLTHTVSTTATDRGLGLSSISLLGAGDGTHTFSIASGTLSNGCNTNAGRSTCNTSQPETFNFRLNEGTTALSLSDSDVAGNTTNSSSWSMKIDRSAPSTPALSGTLYTQRNGWLGSGGSELTLTVHGTDSVSGVSGFNVHTDVAGSSSTDSAVSCANPCSGTYGASYARRSDAAQQTITISDRDAADNTTSAPSFSVKTDHSTPAIANITQTGLPSTWTDDQDNPIQSTVTATDPESGVHHVTLRAPGMPDQTHSFGCTAAFATPCPATASTSFSYGPTASDGSYQLPEGDDVISATAYDATGQASPASNWHLKIDRSGPTIAFSGPLYDNSNQVQSGGSPVQVNVTATDGTANVPASGVESLQVLVDGDEVAYNEQSCASGSCSMTQSPTIVPSDYAGGSHVVEAIATDQLGHETTSDMTFTTGPCCSRTTTTWGSSITYYGAPTTDMAYADASGDGSADAISRNKLTGDVEVGVSDGAGSFTASTRWGSWPIGYDFRSTDVNGDGNADILGRDPQTGLVYAGISDGSSFAPPVVWGTTNPSDEYYLAEMSGTGDDGEQLGSDLITRNTSTGDVSVAEANGTGWDPSELAANAAPSLRLAFADANGDGLDDLITYDPSSKQVQVGLSDAGSFATPAAWGISANSDPQFADVNGDLMADLISRSSTGEVDVQSSDSASFTAASGWGSFGTSYDLNLADTNGDGEQDVLGRSTLGDLAVSLSNMAPPLGVPADATPDAGIIDDVEDPTVPDPAGALTSTDDPTPVAYTASTPKMQLMWADDGQLLGSNRDQSLQRIKQAGATIVRLDVYWGHWQADTPGAPTGYRADIEATVNAIKTDGMTPYLTLTGAGYDVEINNHPTNVFQPGGSDGYSGNPDITVANYASFVSEVVSDPALSDVHLYSIWNEPNTGTFLKFDCGDNISRHTADLYRALYQAGYNAVKNNKPSARVFIGELSENGQHGRTACSGTRKDRHSWTTIQFLDHVASSTSDPLYTNGVAWHAYQHYTPPGKRSNRETGIWHITDMQNKITSLYGSKGSRRLTAIVLDKKTGKPVAARPGLFITEFGLFNRPRSKSYKDWPKSYQTETQRYSWYRQALSRARKPPHGRGARAFLIYETAEEPPQYTDGITAKDNLGGFDTGLLNSVAPTRPGDEPLLSPYGTRPYGKGGPQPRRAYCGIVRWSAANGLLAPGTPCPPT